MAAASPPQFARDWRLVALIGCVSFPASLALYRYAVPLDAWAGSTPELPVSALAAGLTAAVAMLIAAIGAARRGQVDNTRMRVAINNMSQGLCMFDRNERLVVCNRRYMDLYQLPDEVVKPGRTLASLLEFRVTNGSFSCDPDQYRHELVAAMVHGETTTAEVKSITGRVVCVINRPMPDGGWVATHEDITERREAERERHQPPEAIYQRRVTPCPRHTRRITGQDRDAPIHPLLVMRQAGVGVRPRRVEG